MIIPQAIPPAGYHFRDIQLEMSLKPFWDNSPETREAVCREIFLQWLPLCRYADSVSIMLWIGDGSEILEYQGDPSVEFEWGRYHGSANSIHVHSGPPPPDSGNPDHDSIGADARVRDPEKRGVHSRSYLYRPEPAKFSYAWLSELIKTLKRVGAEITGTRIQVGTTFDIGPEFAVSRFKYEWHREICGGAILFGGSFIRCDAALKGDQRKYAGFPQGIPEGTTVGRFLGKQCHHFFKDCPFDFIWFSNGFGFALEPWALTGNIFDGLNYRTDKVHETSKQILKFWQEFREEVPDVPVRTRGTNLTTGIDMGSDASPILDIYKSVAHVEPPVNSPWAALDGDIGLELSGWMSHIARVPGKGYRFRFYPHDPWWLNSPWLDRFQRQPYDIYIPLSVSRMNADGTVEPPSDLAFLTIDDSHGCMPPSVPVEVTSHILHGREYMPDAAGPIVWVYPFKEYNDLVFSETPKPELPFSGDWFVRGIIEHGVPVNTVINTDDVHTVLEKHPKSLAGSVLLVPAIAETEKLLKVAQEGGTVLFYGPLQDCADLREALGISLAEPLDGDFEVIDDARAGSRKLRHLSFLSAGGWTEAGGDAKDVSSIIAHRGNDKRVISAVRSFPSGGQIGWVRGSLATSEFDPANPKPIKGPRLSNMDPTTFVGGEEFAHSVLAQMHLTVDCEKQNGKDRTPKLTIHRNRNAFVFSGYQPDVSATLNLSLPLGAPLFEGMQNLIQGKTNKYSGPPAWHNVCRAFVEQPGEGYVTCRITPPVQRGYTLRNLVSGLKNATVRFFPEPGTEKRLEILKDPYFPYFKGDFVEPKFIQGKEGTYVEIENVTGEILFSW